MFCLDENSWRRKRPEFLRQTLFWGSPHPHLWSHELELSWKRGLFIFVCRRCSLKDISKWRWKASSFHYLEAWRSKPFNTMMQQLLCSVSTAFHMGVYVINTSVTQRQAPEEMLCNSVCSAWAYWVTEMMGLWTLLNDGLRLGKERRGKGQGGSLCSSLFCDSVLLFKDQAPQLVTKTLVPTLQLIPFCSHDTTVPGISPHLRVFAHAGLAAWNVISSSSLLSSCHSSNLNQTPSSVSWTPRLDRVLTGLHTIGNCRINHENNCWVPVSWQYKHQG